MTRIWGRLIIGLAIVGSLAAVLGIRAEDPQKSAAPATQVVEHTTFHPTQVMWNAEFKKFAVWLPEPQTAVEISPTGALVGQSYRGTVPQTVTSQVTLADGSEARVDPWQPQVMIVDGKEARTIPVPARPMGIAAIPGTQKVIVVCDTIPERKVCRIDVSTDRVIQQLALPGVSNVRDVAVSPDGTMALVTHLIPKSHLPSSQIEQGWVFTNAVTVLDLRSGLQILATAPLDLRTEGFANPQGVAFSPDGKRAYVTHAGADVVSVIDVEKLLALKNSAGDATAYDLTLTRKYIKARIPVGANPWGVAVSADGNVVAVANRLDDSVSLIDAKTNAVTKTVPLNRDRPSTDTAKGERLFVSGKLSFSGQFSCISCHPDGHTDGLNWDLPADGFNNFQNTKSLLGLDGTSPYGWQGLSGTIAERFTGTLQHLFQHEPSPEETASLAAYLGQLKYPATLPPRESPDSASAQRGRALFFGAGGCGECHAGSKFTDKARHDIGLGGEYDTPSLLRVSETAPYLHDGRAPTLESIFRTHNSSKLHGQIPQFTDDQWHDLEAFLRSL